MDHTTERIFQLLNEETISSLESYTMLKMIHKVGFDGSLGQSVYKQFTTETKRNLNIEDSLFLTCTVPLELSDSNGNSIWMNLKPSSTLLVYSIYCRTMRFRFVKEKKQVFIEEHDFIRKADLSPTLIGTLSVEHVFEITMTDGKVATALSKVTDSSQSCSVCACTPKHMNNLDKVTKQSFNETGLEHGLSTLHA